MSERCPSRREDHFGDSHHESHRCGRPKGHAGVHECHEQHDAGARSEYDEELGFCTRTWQNRMRRASRGKGGA